MKQQMVGMAVGPRRGDHPSSAWIGPTRRLASPGRAWVCMALMLSIAWLLLQPRAAIASNAPFDAFYAEMVQALDRRDAQAMFARYAPSYVVTDPQGRRKPLKQVRAEAERSLKLFRQLRFQVRVVDVQRKGTRAEVAYQTRLEAEVVADDGRRQRVVVESQAEDRWEQPSGEWRIVATQVRSEKNLSPAPTPPTRANGNAGAGGSGGFDTAATDLALKYANGCYASQLREFCDRLNRHVAHWMARCETQRTPFACNTANRVVEIDVGMRAANSRPRF